MNKELLSMIINEPTEDEIRALCREKQESLGFDIEKALLPVNPLEIDPKISIDEARELLKVWASVGDSVGDSVRDSVGDSVGAPVRASVWASVGASVGAPVRASVWDSVGAPVWDSVWAYISSIFYNIDFKIEGLQAGIDLWEAGYVASFDGTYWRLHTKNGIVFTVNVDNL